MVIMDDLYEGDGSVTGALHVMCVEICFHVKKPRRNLKNCMGRFIGKVGYIIRIPVVTETTKTSHIVVQVFQFLLQLFIPSENRFWKGAKMSVYMYHTEDSLVSSMGVNTNVILLEGISMRCFNA